MPLVLADRVRETTTTTGTGAITLAGPYTGFQPFSVIGNGNTTYYAIIDAATGAWEVGLGTYASAGNTLARTAVLASSSGGALVNFSAGVKDAIITQPASRAVYVDGAEIAAGNNAKVPNSLLANSSVTIGSTNVALGATAASLAGLTSVSTGALSASGNITLSAGTGNGVPFLNGSKVLTTGSALTFDGSSLYVGNGSTQNAFVLNGGATGSAVIGQRSGANHWFVGDTAAAIGSGAGLINYVYGSNPVIWYTAGAEQMRLTSTGLGIGTSSPAYKLDVNGTAGFTGNMAVGANWNSGVRLYVTGANNTSAGIAGLFVNSDGLQIANFRNDLAVTMGNGAFNLSASGNLGIGTSSPVSLGSSIATLDLASANGGGLRFRTSGAGNSAYLLANASGVDLFTLDNLYMRFGTNGSERMRLDASGNLGIGTSSPASRLHLTAPANVRGIAQNTNAAGSTGGAYWDMQTAAATAGSAWFRAIRGLDESGNLRWVVGQYGAPEDTIAFYTGTAAIERARIDNAGRFGIGTIAPDARLCAVADTDGTVARFNTIVGHSTSTAIQLGGYATGFSGAGAHIRAYHHHVSTIASSLAFEVNGTQEAARITSAGNLGIGTSSPNGRLTVKGGAAQLDVNTSGSEVTLEAIDRSETSNSVSMLYYARSFGIHAWYNAAYSERMRIDSSGNLLVGTTGNPRSARAVFDSLNLGRSALEVRADFNQPSISFAGGPLMRSDGNYLVIQTPTGAGDRGIYLTAGSNIFFSTNDTERARIDSSGNLLVGKTAPDDTAGAGFIVYSGGGRGAVTATMSTASSQNTYHLFNDNGTNYGYRFYVNVNGGIYNFAGNNVNLSDRRDKTDIEPAGEYLDKICAIPVVTFNYAGQAADDPGKTLGVIAQDVQEIAPEFVKESNWGTEDEPKMRLSVYQTDLQYGLMKAVQELKAVVDAQAARIATLEAK